MNPPNLLLHNVGKIPNLNADNLFHTEKHRILWNTSGSGKTRLLFEGLCQNWGFYFAVAQGGDYVGSLDFQEMLIERIWSSPDWVGDIFEDNDPVKVSSASSNNERIAATRTSKVVLARWIVFDAFIKVAKDLNGGVLHDNIRHHWLLFQALPRLYRDPFRELANSLPPRMTLEECDFLKSELTPTSILGSAFNPAVDSFFYVLDEAQVAGSQHMEAFADTDGKVPQPVLRPIIGHLTSVSHPGIKTIVSGTGFSLKFLETLLNSGVAKGSAPWEVVHTTGDFSNQDTQLAYISRYLPPNFLLSPAGDVLKARMYEWLRGRHRFTASYLEHLIRGRWEENCPASPHKQLDTLVHQLADFTPLDADASLLGQEADISPSSVGGFSWKRIERAQDLKGVLAHLMFNYVTQGQHPMWYDDYAEIVDYGPARFAGDSVTIDEPLALIGAMHFFDDRKITLEGDIRASLQDDKGTMFQEAVLFAITKLLQNKRALNVIFQLWNPYLDWPYYSAQVVSQVHPGDFRPFDIVASGSVTPFDGVAFCAQDPEDVKQWITGGRGAGWCVPGEQMGPDMMTWLRLGNGELLLLVVQVKCYLSGDRDASTAESIPSTQTIPKQEEASRMITAALEAINTLPEAFTQGRFDILRVITAFPGEAGLKPTSESVEDVLGRDDSTTALLSRSALVSVLATCPHSTSVMKKLKETLKKTRGEAGLDEDTEMEHVPEI